MSSSVAARLSFSVSSARVFSKSKLGTPEATRPVFFSVAWYLARASLWRFSPRTTSDTRSGQPPSGQPKPPIIMSMTDSGNGMAAGSRFTTSAGLIPLLKRKSAMSPTTFELGVTFTMSPKSWLTSA